MGVLVHGHGTYFYVCHPTVSKGAGPNFTIECLMRTLEKVSHRDYDGGKLPPHLFLQLDNCTGSNKNKFVFGLCNLLVHFHSFESVTVSFLIVGHTHEDLDQIFSIISRHLHTLNLDTADDFMDAVLDALKNHYLPSFIEQVYQQFEYKKYIKKHLDPKLKYYTIPHVFSFTRGEAYQNDDGDLVSKVTFKYKHYHRSTTWYPLPREGNMYSIGKELKGDEHNLEDLKSTCYLEIPKSVRKVNEFLRNKEFIGKKKKNGHCIFGPSLPKR